MPLSLLLPELRVEVLLELLLLLRVTPVVERVLLLPLEELIAPPVELLLLVRLTPADRVLLTVLFVGLLLPRVIPMDRVLPLLVDPKNLVFEALR